MELTIQCDLHPPFQPVESVVRGAEGLDSLSTGFRVTLELHVLAEAVPEHFRMLDPLHDGMPLDDERICHSTQDRVLLPCT